VATTTRVVMRSSSVEGAGHLRSSNRQSGHTGLFCPNVKAVKRVIPCMPDSVDAGKLRTNVHGAG